MKTKGANKKSVKIITLGCSKNTVDSEVMMRQLQAGGVAVQSEFQDKEYSSVIINTCGFIDKAKEESIETILQFAEAKKQGWIEELYVTGCLSQRYKDNLEQEIPEVDAYFGTMELPLLLNKYQVDYKKELLGERIFTLESPYAYVKISEGCNRKCSFCAIPQMRGLHKSRTIESLVEEAQWLAKKGIKELILIAQELTYYGLDLYKTRSLDRLLHELSAVEGIEWIRLHYAYPSQFPMEILDAMRELPKVCNYLDIPLQHVSDKVLKDMKRNITKAQTVQLIQTIREKVPNIAIRTSLLTGFPTETEGDFEELCQFVEEMKFDRLGVFTYSQEDDTTAFALGDPISEEEKMRRQEVLMDIQRGISYDLNQTKVGKTYKTIVDSVEDGYYIGRTEHDSPEVDNEVIIYTSRDLKMGDFVDVTIHNATEYDLEGAH